MHVLANFRGLSDCLTIALSKRRVAIVLTRCTNGSGVQQCYNDSNKLGYGQSPLCKVRNERNFYVRRPNAAQFAVMRKGHDAEHAMLRFVS